MYIDISGACPGQTGHIVYTVRAANGISRGRIAVRYYSAFMHCCHCELDTIDDELLDRGRATLAICGMIHSSYNRFKSHNQLKPYFYVQFEWDNIFGIKVQQTLRSLDDRACVCLQSTNESMNICSLHYF